MGSTKVFLGAGIRKAKGLRFGCQHDDVSIKAFHGEQ
jgi:hypothetical protein